MLVGMIANSFLDWTNRLPRLREVAFLYGCKVLSKCSLYDATTQITLHFSVHLSQ